MIVVLKSTASGFDNLGYNFIDENNILIVITSDQFKS